MSKDDDDFDPFGLKIKRASRWPEFSLSHVFAVLLAVWTVKWGWDVWSAWASRSWPTVQGEFTWSASGGGSGLKARRPWRGFGSGRRRGFVVEYAYRPSPKGEALTAGRIRFGITASFPDIRRRYGGDRSRSDEKVKGVTGQAVTVHYNPRRPSVAVLEPGLHWNGVGLEAFYLFSAWFFLFLVSMTLGDGGSWPLWPSRRSF